jgi:hypothetical protein
MEAVIPTYTPLDLQAVEKQVSKLIKKINTDKDLESEIHDIQIILKDLSKYSFRNF